MLPLVGSLCGTSMFGTSGRDCVRVAAQHHVRSDGSKLDRVPLFLVSATCICGGRTGASLIGMKEHGTAPDVDREMPELNRVLGVLGVTVSTTYKSRLPIFCRSLLCLSYALVNASCN